MPNHLQKIILEIDSRIKDPLTILKISTQQALTDTPRNRKTRHQLGLMLRQIQRITSILKEVTDRIQQPK